MCMLLVAGDEKRGISVLQAAERKFNTSLEWHQQLLTFDLYWAVGKARTCSSQCFMVHPHVRICFLCSYGPRGFCCAAGSAPDYWYANAPAGDQAAIQDIAKRAYAAVSGNGCVTSLVVFTFCVGLDRSGRWCRVYSCLHSQVRSSGHSNGFGRVALRT